MKKRQISEEMKKDFLIGELKPLLEAVHEDDTLCLELRGNFTDIYYRGGTLYKIEDAQGIYKISIDENYLSDRAKNLLPIISASDAVDKIPCFKCEMDKWFHLHHKYEREYQQLILCENNNNKEIAHSSDYYIIDLEFADSEEKEDYRFDMIALKWPSTSVSRKDTNKPSLVLFENKYGDGALGGNAGLKKHLDDFKVFLSNQSKVEELKNDMQAVFRQKCELGLIAGLKESQFNVKLSSEVPEVVFILANHDPESKKLKSIICGVDESEYEFPILFAESSLMGYGLYETRMKTLEDIRKAL